MSTDPFAHHDAAYVLGSLSPEERRDYEAHLETCADCTQAVREVAAMPGLLARVPLEDVLSPAEPPPATLLPALSRRVRAERNRRTRRWSLAAAASVLALAGTGAWVVTAGQEGAAPVAGAALTQVASTPVHANARLVDVAWGTRIDLTCTYDAGSAGSYGARYALVVVDRAGKAEQVATWTAVPGRVSQVTAATGWKKSDIARVEVRTQSGAPVLRLVT